MSYEPIYRTPQEEIFCFGVEAAKLAVTTPSVGAVPTLYVAGYTDGASIDTAENAQVLQNIGTYRGVTTFKGRREHTMRTNIRLGSAEILRFGIRSSVNGLAGATGAGFVTPTGSTISMSYSNLVKGLPLIAIGGGTMDVTDPDAALTMLGRYGVIRETSFAFQEGSNSPFNATLEVWPLCKQIDSNAATAIGNLAGSTIAAHEAKIVQAGGPQLMWQHATWTIGGVDYRELLKSVSIRVANTLERVGCRNDGGDDIIYSRCCNAIIPLSEEVTVELGLIDQLPDSFIHAAGASGGSVGQIILTASNLTSPSVSGQRTVTITINQNQVARHGKAGVQPGQLLSFTGSFVSRVITVTQSTVA